MDMNKPISPDQIAEAKLHAIPDYVFKSINELLAIKYVGKGKITITQDSIVEKILENSPENIDRSAIFSRGYLNFEEAYRAAGWSVHYDKPGYCESYDAFFEFARK